MAKTCQKRMAGPYIYVVKIYLFVGIFTAVSGDNHGCHITKLLFVYN